MGAVRRQRAVSIGSAVLVGRPCLFGKRGALTTVVDAGVIHVTATFLQTGCLHGHTQVHLPTYTSW